MKTMLVALAMAATLAVAAAALLGDRSGRLTSTVEVSAAANERAAYLAAPDPGYILYSGYAAILPGPNCYWTRMPVYDIDHTVIGWRGRPVAVCPQWRVTARSGE